MKCKGFKINENIVLKNRNFKTCFTSFKMLKYKSKICQFYFIFFLILYFCQCLVMYVVALHNNSTGKGETPFDTPFNLSKTHFKNTSSDCIFKSSFFYKLLRLYRQSQTLTLFAFIKCEV